MANQTLYPYSTTINAAELQLFNLAIKIFSARDFYNVEEEIAWASKIRFGLMALEAIQEITEPAGIVIEDGEFLTDFYADRQKIIVGLNYYAPVYNQQEIPNITP